MIFLHFITPDLVDPGGSHRGGQPQTSRRSTAGNLMSKLEMNVEAHRERCGTMTRDHSRHLQPIGSSIASVSGSGEHLFGTPLGTVRTSSGGSGSARVGKPDELPRASRGSGVRLRDRCGTANAPDAPFPAWGGSGGWLHLGSPSALESRCGAGRDLQCYRPRRTTTADPAITRATGAPW